MIEIDENLVGQCIDNFLLCVCKGVLKSYIYWIFCSGEVCVNKGWIDVQYCLEFGDFVCVLLVCVVVVDFVCVDMFVVLFVNFDVLYEDDVMFVIDKLVGVVVYGGSGVVFGVIEQMCQVCLCVKFFELVYWFDCEMFGILMFVKKCMVFVGLYEQICENWMDKCYFVCVYGEWQFDWGWCCVVKVLLFKYLILEGECCVWVQEDGFVLYMVFNFVDCWLDYVFVEVEFKMGWIYQIWVYFVYFGLLIVGDVKYGDFVLNKVLVCVNVQLLLKWMFLYVYCFKFVYLLIGEVLQFDVLLLVECWCFFD